MKVMREVSGANGKGGSYADTTHEEKERGEGKAPFLGPSQKGSKKRQKQVLSRRQAGKKKREEVGKGMQCRSIEGYLGHLQHLSWCFGTFRNQKIMAEKPKCKRKKREG